MPDPARNSRLLSLGGSLGIRAGEGATTLLLLGQAFFLGVALLTAYTPANALFLETFSTDSIPHTYLAAAGLLTLAGLAFIRLSRMLPLSVLLVGTFTLITGIQTALWLGLQFAPSDRLYFLAMVWFRLSWVVGNLVLWALVNRLLDVRQAKRLFPLITAACVLAIILSGAAISPLVSLLGVTNLTAVSAAALVVALVLLLVTVCTHADRLGRSEHDPKARAKAATPTRVPQPAGWRPYLALMSIYTAFSTVGTYVLDYAFLGLAGSYFRSAEDLARFFGYYLSAMTFSLLLFTVLVSGRLFRRFGMSCGVLANPALVAMGAMLAAAAGVVLGPAASLFFYAVVATKLFDELMVPSMTTPSVRILLQPLGEDERVRAQAVVESVVAPLSIGVAGLLLIFFAQVMRLSPLDAIYLLLGLLVGWLYLGLRLSRAYPGALYQALSADVPPVATQRQVDSSAEGELAQTLSDLESADPRIRRSALEALHQRQQPPGNDRRNLITQALQREGAVAAHWVATAVDVDGFGDDALDQAIDDERHQALERIILTAALLDDRALLVSCLPALADVRGPRRSLALEGLDTALPRSLRPWVLPLAQDVSDMKRQVALQKVFPPEHLPQRERLRRLAADERASERTRQCAKKALQRCDTQ